MVLDRAIAVFLLHERKLGLLSPLPPELFCGPDFPQARLAAPMPIGWLAATNTKPVLMQFDLPGRLVRSVVLAPPKS
jgi:hypothetical protein